MRVWQQLVAASLGWVARKGLQWRARSAWLDDWWARAASSALGLSLQPAGAAPGAALQWDGLLWGAVPKKRRSLERRLERRHGFTKMRDFASPKRNLVACLTCGGWHLFHTICPHCYARVRDETARLQTALDSRLEALYGPDPLPDKVNREVAFAFTDDQPAAQPPSSPDAAPQKSRVADGIVNGVRVVEIDTPRPSWFPNNLLERARRK